MTFLEIQNEVTDRLNLTSDQAITRVGREINARYKRVTSSIGLLTSRPVEVLKAVTLGNQYVVFSGITKIVSVHHRMDGIRLNEVTYEEIPVLQIAASGTADSGSTTTVVDAERTETLTTDHVGSIIQFTSGTLDGQSSVITAFSPSTDTLTFSPAVSPTVTTQTYNILAGNSESARDYAIYAMGATTVTIILDRLPSAAATLYAEGLIVAATLSGSGVPAFAEDFHDILVFGAVADELRKMEKVQLAKDAESDFEQRLSDLRMFIAKSAYLDMYQGKTNSERNWSSNVWLDRNGT